MFRLEPTLDFHTYSMRQDLRQPAAPEDGGLRSRESPLDAIRIDTLNFDLDHLQNWWCEHRCEHYG